MGNFFPKRVSYLFTFCPPGPEDLLKLNSPMLFSGIASACKPCNHERAARRSSLAAPVSLDDARVRRSTKSAHLVIATREGARGVRQRSMFRLGEIMVAKTDGERRRTRNMMEPLRLEIGST